MPVPVELFGGVNKALLHTEDAGHSTHLIIEQHARVHSVFKSVTFIDASTTTLITPPGNSALVIVDFIISAEKVAAGKVTIRLTDGTNNEDIMTAHTVDGPVNLAFSPQGRWAGWKDARVDIISVGTNIDGTVSLGYYFVPASATLEYDEWTSRRGD